MRPCLSLMTKFITTSLDTGIMANSAACSNPGGSKFPQLFCLTVVFALPAFHLCLPCGRTRAWASPTPPEKAQSARKIGTAIGCPPEMPLQQRGPISYKRRQRALYLQSNMKLAPDLHLLPPPPRDSNKHKRKMKDIVADLSIQSEKEAIAIILFR